MRRLSLPYDIDIMFFVSDKMLHQGFPSKKYKVML